MDGVADAPAVFALWGREMRQRYPAVWEKATTGRAGEELQKAKSENNPCSVAKAQFSLDMSALGTVNAEQFHNWQQFHNIRYEREQKKLDAQSGLRNTGDFSKAYFGADSEFPCYRFTASSKLTMPVLVIVGKYDGAVGAEQMRALAGRLPHAVFDEFDQSAHFPYAEQPDKFVRDVTAFLAR